MVTKAPESSSTDTTAWIGSSPMLPPWQNRNKIWGTKEKEKATGQGLRHIQGKNMQSIIIYTAKT